MMNADAVFIVGVFLVGLVVVAQVLDWIRSRM
jgi:hypothetical protein